MCVSTMFNAFCSVNAYSEYNLLSDEKSEVDNSPTYTFNQLMQMTDEEVLLLSNNDYDENRYKPNFGDETLTDEEKFEAFCNFDESYGKLLYNCYKEFASGANIFPPYFSLYVDNKYQLDYSATAEDFGFPSDWELTCYTGEYFHSSYSDDTGWAQNGAEYRLFVPLEIFNDYETYVRLHYAKESQYTVNKYEDMFEVCNIHEPSVTTTEPTKTTEPIITTEPIESTTENVSGEKITDTKVICDLINEEIKKSNTWSSEDRF